MSKKVGHKSGFSEKSRILHPGRRPAGGREIFLRAPGESFPRNDSPGDEKYASRLAYSSPWKLPGNFLGKLFGETFPGFPAGWPAGHPAGLAETVQISSGFLIFPSTHAKVPNPYLCYPGKAAFSASAHSILFLLRDVPVNTPILRPVRQKVPENAVFQGTMSILG